MLLPNDITVIPCVYTKRYHELQPQPSKCAIVQSCYSAVIIRIFPRCHASSWRTRIPAAWCMESSAAAATASQLTQWPRLRLTSGVGEASGPDETLQSTGRRIEQFSASVPRRPGGYSSCLSAICSGPLVASAAAAGVNWFPHLMLRHAISTMLLGSVRRSNDLSMSAGRLVLIVRSQAVVALCWSVLLSLFQTALSPTTAVCSIVNASVRHLPPPGRSPSTLSCLLFKR